MSKLGEKPRQTVCLYLLGAAGALRPTRPRWSVLPSPLLRRLFSIGPRVVKPAGLSHVTGR